MQQDNLIHDMYMKELQSGLTYQLGGKFCTGDSFSGGNQYPSPFILVPNPEYVRGDHIAVVKGNGKNFLRIIKIVD